MWKDVLELLLWLFLVGNGGLIYFKALTMFQNAATTMQDWVGLSIGSIFLAGFAVLVYRFGSAGLDYLAALVPAKKAD